MMSADCTSRVAYSYYLFPLVGMYSISYLRNTYVDSSISWYLLTLFGMFIKIFRNEEMLSHELLTPF